MAANLDKSENSLTSVSTLTYLRGIDASGNSVKISTSDLASVLGDSNVNINSTSPSEIRKAGIYWVNVGASPEDIRAEYPNSSSVDILIVLTTHNGSNLLHTCQIDINNYGVCFLRVAYGGSEPFSNWKQL